jgi:predicted outer membrane repeat protein
MSLKHTAFGFRFFSIILLLILLVGPLSVTPVHAANECYVWEDATSGTNTGTSWTNAYTSLQSALDNPSCTEIWVAAGTYKPTSDNDRAISFTLKDGVDIYGGFAGTEIARDDRDPEENVTTLSGDIGTEGITTDNSYHVVSGVNLTASAILDGFIITAGNANDDTNPNNSGGGMLLDNSSPTLTNVTFSANSAYAVGGGMFLFASSPILTNVSFSDNNASYGGGMALYNSSSPNLTNVTFSANYATDYGGGMFLTASSPTLTDITFSANTAIGGGGMFLNNSSPGLTNITFSGNTALGGGGMYLDTSSPTLTNVTFSANTASTNGGGMVLFSSSPTLANVSFSYNQATHYGGAIYNNSSNPGLTNITINNNSLTGTHAYGGGIYNENSSPTLTYVTFSENLVSGSTASGGGGMINWNSSHPILTNVTFTGNQATGTEAYAYGGGLLNDTGSNPTLTNVTFSNNSATSGGGGMTNNDGSSPTLTNVTFSGNNASLGGGMINGYSSPNPTLRNTIFWGNTADSGTTSQHQIYTITGTPVVSDSVIQGGYTGGVNIITTNPNLGTLGSYGGFTRTIPLLPGSSAIDAGDTCPLTDQRGNSRVGGCDIGAFESQGFTFSSPTGTNQSALINTAFTTPLGLTVTANAAGEPVNGGVVTFTSSLSNAWRTNPATFTAEIAGGVVSAPAAANGFAGGPYQVTASATGVASGVNFNLTNDKATPVITWNNPADIVYGTPLSVTQLNAVVADVAGTFTYTPASGTILDVGDDQNLHVDFTPGQPDYYNSVSFDVEINVSARELEITGIAANNKVYDGAVSGNGYSGGTLVGIIGTDDVSLDGDSAVLTFDDPNVGNGIGVTASGFGLEGTDAGNYILAQPVGLTAEITAMPVTITPDAGQSKVIGDADPVFTYTHTELKGSDVITGALGREAGELPGNYIYTLGTLTAGLNYSLSLAEEAFNITAVTEAATTTTTLTATANPDKIGDSWTLTATVASDSGTPSGSVTFKVGTQTLGTVALSNGVASINTGRLPGGAYSFTAEFDGSADYTASVSNALNLNAKYYLIFPIIFR